MSGRGRRWQAGPAEEREAHTPFAHGLILGEKGRSTFFYAFVTQYTGDSATSHAILQRSQ